MEGAEATAHGAAVAPSSPSAATAAGAKMPAGKRRKICPSNNPSTTEPPPHAVTASCGAAPTTAGRSFAVGAATTAKLPPTPNGSRGSGAGGACAEKAVHPSPAEQAAASSKGESAAAAATGGSAAGSQALAARGREDRRGAAGIVAAAEAWCGAEASSLKRDAQMATKRSWDDFENDNSGGGGAKAQAALADAAGVTTTGLGGNGCGSSVQAGPGGESPPGAGSGGGQQSQGKPPAAAAAAAASSADCCRPRAPTTLPVTRMPESVEAPEVAEARAALEEARELMGVNLPSLDKGPEADCVLCHIPRGAFLRAETGKKLGWCHVLCALSKGLVIEDRVVKVGGCRLGEARRVGRRSWFALGGFRKNNLCVYVLRSRCILR